MKNKLSEPINISEFENYDEIIEYIYSIFKEDLMDRENREKLSGEFIFIDCTKWIINKPEMFWHLISLSELETFNIFPCNNDSSYNSCNENCIVKNKQILLLNGQKRNICYYRAIRIKWINEIIHLANQNDSRIKKWIMDDKLHIRFSEGETDYILIFKDNSNNKNHYYLITAFPVFYINSKKISIKII